jgi:DsbC/DsbD-like thiol-disulfide interchange protein
MPSHISRLLPRVYFNLMLAFFSLVLALLNNAADASIQPVKWKLIGGEGVRRVAAGKIVALQLQGEIAPGWHIYSLTQKPGGPIPLRISLSNAADVSIRGTITAPKPVRTFDKNFGLTTELYSGRALFSVPVGVPTGSRLGTRRISLDSRYQVCSDKLCLPARTQKFDVTLQVTRR